MVCADKILNRKEYFLNCNKYLLLCKLKYRGIMKRQITDSDKIKIKNNNLDANGFVKCFIDNELILDEKEIQFDHIIPFVKTEDSSLNNIAPVCAKHNLAKKDMSLSEYRDKLEMDRLFVAKDDKGEQLKLNEILSTKLNDNYGFPVFYNYDVKKESVTLKIFNDKEKIKLPTEETFRVFTCPISGMNYFYAMIPVKNILNDGREESELELQPRPIMKEHLWNLYRHLRVNTQLQPSIGRLKSNSSILIFDGQHKAAARIWAGAKEIEVKVYIEPEVTWLMRTNLVAHDKLKQLRFYSSILADKLAQLYGANWQKYFETMDKKTEKGFCNFIKYADDKSDEKPEKQIQAFLITSILSIGENKFSQFIAPENKTGKQYAISWDSMNKYYFRYFLTPPPLEVEFDSKEDFRNQEIENNIKLLNILANKILINKWNPNASDNEHKKAERIFRPGAIMVWFPMLRDIVFNKLDLVRPDEAKQIFFRNIPNEKWNIIDKFIEKMFSNKIWIERDTNIDVVIGNKKAEYTKKLFVEKGFSTEWVLGINGN